MVSESGRIVSLVIPGCEMMGRAKQVTINTRVDALRSCQTTGECRHQYQIETKLPHWLLADTEAWVEDECGYANWEGHSGSFPDQSEWGLRIRQQLWRKKPSQVKKLIQRLQAINKLYGLTWLMDRKMWSLVYFWSTHCELSSQPTRPSAPNPSYTVIHVHVLKSS